MKKPPFQFGLKAVFKVITAFAVLLGIGTAVPQLPLFVVAVAAISLPFVLCGVLCNKVAITLMELAPHEPRTPSRPPNSLAPADSPIQFGLKAMFAAITGFALFFAALSYAPDHIYGLCFFVLAAIAIVFAPAP